MFHDWTKMILGTPVSEIEPWKLSIKTFLVCS